MKTPFDAHAAEAWRRGYHNHRSSTHDHVISDGIMRDLYNECNALREDLDSHRVGAWKTTKQLWGRKRNTDLVVALPGVARKKLNAKHGDPWYGAAADCEANTDQPIIVIEHKSVLTAHRNKTNRFTDLNIQSHETGESGLVISAATLMVGTARYYLNIPDRVKPFYERAFLDDNGDVALTTDGRVKKELDKEKFDSEVMSRIRANDRRSLMRLFGAAVSVNKESDPANTIARFFDAVKVNDSLHLRRPGRFDAVLVAPVFYDNMSQPKVLRGEEALDGFDVDEAYARFIKTIGNLYTGKRSAFVPEAKPRRLAVKNVEAKQVRLD